MSDPIWSLFLGCLLITMVLVGSLLSRFLLSSAMIYLAVGYLIGPGGFGAISPDPILDAEMLERVAGIALLISLFSVGLKLGSIPLFDRRWLRPLRLAFISMAITVGLIAAAAMLGMGMSLGAAILMGAILAPTDPVLASGLQASAGADPDRLRFALAAEGGLNDGTAFPFVILGLGLLGHEGFGADPGHWFGVDFLWASVGGLLVGTVSGALIGRLVVYLRTRHKQAVGLDEFLSLGLVAVAYGAATLCLGSGFLAVFAAGLALQRVKDRPQRGTQPLREARASEPWDAGKRAVHSHHASTAMTDAVRGFNEQLEKLAELAIVLLVGAMLPHSEPSPALWWFIPLLFIVLRALAVSIGLAGDAIAYRERVMTSWFGIRGIGSVFYLMFAIHHGVGSVLAQDLVSITLTTVAASILMHGMSVRPLMRWYGRCDARVL